jgi:hypothetical protein
MGAPIGVLLLDALPTTPRCGSSRSQGPGLLDAKITTLVDDEAQVISQGLGLFLWQNVVRRCGQFPGARLVCCRTAFMVGRCGHFPRARLVSCKNAFMVGRKNVFTVGRCSHFPRARVVSWQSVFMVGPSGHFPGLGNIQKQVHVEDLGVPKGPICLLQEQGIYGEAFVVPKDSIWWPSQTPSVGLCGWVQKQRTWSTCHLARTRTLSWLCHRQRALRRLRQRKFPALQCSEPRDGIAHARAACTLDSLPQLFSWIFLNLLSTRPYP